LFERNFVQKHLLFVLGLAILWGLVHLGGNNHTILR